MDRGSWWATVHRVVNTQTQLKQLSMHAYMRRSKPHKNMNGKQYRSHPQYNPQSLFSNPFFLRVWKHLINKHITIFALNLWIFTLSEINKDSKFSPTIFLGLLLCPWMWGIFFGWIQHSPVDGCSAMSCQFWSSQGRKWVHNLRLHHLVIDSWNGQI